MIVAFLVLVDDDNLEEDFLFEGLVVVEEEEEDSASVPAEPVPAVLEAALSAYSVEAFSPPASARVSRPKPAITDDTARGGPPLLSPFFIPRCNKNIPIIEMISRQVQTPRMRITRPLRRSIPPCG